MKIEAKRFRDFSRDHDYDAFTVIRVYNSLQKDLGGRNSWVTVSNGQKKRYRRVLGSGSSGLGRDEIELDYDSRLELEINGSKDEKISILVS